MSATLEITCPKCGKDFKVPVEFAGKTIRCKNCQTAFQVPAAGGRPVPAKPVAAKPAAAVAARPAKPATAAPAAPPDANAPIPFKQEEAPPAAHASRDVDDDDEKNPYGVIKESEVPRCPFCAKEFDPPDANVCLNCGFDLRVRKRYETKQVYELSNGDYLVHWLPGIACVLLILTLIGIDVVVWINNYNWAIGSWLDTGDKDTLTGQPKFYVKPWCCPLWMTIIFIVIVAKAGTVAVRRLIIKWRPDEMKKVE